MKKFMVLFVVIMLVVLGVFFWSVNSNKKENRESGTLVMAREK